MPIYDYECRACGKQHEILQSILEGRKRKCPSCGKLKLRRIVSRPARPIFKGTGFYETDYKHNR